MPDRESMSTNALIKNDNDSFRSKTRDFFEKIHVLSVGLIIALALLIRMCTSYYPYSGANKPPMYGDYEAQRHWQEITLNLPISQWYTNSSNNDLQYWGLDYPPLTAYHSLLVAQIAQLVEPKSVIIHKSRGYESNTHKYFMRLSVFAADLVVFIPAVLLFSLATLPISTKGYRASYLALASILLYPGIILIDYGHFQYNCISLGFFIISVSLLLRDCIASGSCFFVLALNYKQMELYHALPFFVYILGHNVNRKPIHSSLYSIIAVSLTVVATFVVVWAPFLTDLQVLKDAVLRLFPIKRGIFEDKVANVWCTINVLYKLKNNISNPHLAFICLVTTACALLPSSVDLFFRPLKDKFLLALVNSSLSFFLFSFQVHEKSILLVAIPVLLQLHKDPLYCFWFLIISVFSMLPLFIKDNLFVAYVASLVLFIVIVSWIEPRVFGLLKKKRNNYVNALFGLSLLGVVIVSTCSMLVKPPKRYPDLHSLLVSTYSCCHFSAFFIYFNYKQIFMINKSKLE